LLTSLYYQTETDMHIIISDQSTRYDVADDPLFLTVKRLLELRQIPVTIHKHLPFLGMAEQRQFLLDQSDSPYSLYLDDDLILDPFVLANLLQVIRREDCGFAGNAVLGLSYRDDYRPDQQQIEYWDNGVKPERIRPGTGEWNRYHLHNAANLWHVQQEHGVSPEQPRAYKVAWVGGCVLYNTRMLRESGGFEFWKELPGQHCGEDVVAQLRVMEKFGGCGVIPSGCYHQELETTLPDRNVNAPEYLEN
jgi:hypothetical protein